MCMKCYYVKIGGNISKYIFIHSLCICCYISKIYTWDDRQGINHWLPMGKAPEW